MRTFLKRVAALVVCSCLILSVCETGVVAAKVTLPKKTTSIRLVVDGKVYRDVSAKNVKTKRDWYVKPALIRKTLGVKVSSTSGGYASLRAGCKKKDVSFEYDKTMSAAYIWTDVPYSPCNDDEIDRAYQLGFASKAQLHNPNKTMTTKAYRAMLVKMIKRTGKSGATKVFDNNVKKYNKKILRGEAFIMTYYAALAIGADTFIRENGLEQEEQDKLYEKPSYWNDKGCALKKLFPNVSKESKLYPEFGHNGGWDQKTMGYYWASCQTSHKTGRNIFTWTKTYNMRSTKALTVKEAIYAVVRLFDSMPAGKDYDTMVSVDSDRAVTMDGTLMTNLIKKKIKALPDITSKNAPAWRGPVLLGNAWFATDTELRFYDMDVHNVANWGFNSARYNLCYESFFNEDATQVNLDNLKKLDELIVSAIRYGIHFDIQLVTLPGRTAKADENFQTTASLDLFVNPERQKEAERVWTILAKRYRDIPNAALTFVPLWEPTNYDLSSGLQAPAYTDADVYNTTKKLIQAIRSQDPKRLIICEPCSNNSAEMVDKYAEMFKNTYLKGTDNLIYQANYCQEAYVYAEMTDTEGASIDLHNHSMFKPEYPTAIYAAAKHIYPGHSLSLSGCLPEGTKLEIYLEQVNGKGEFAIRADEKSLYTESLSNTTYKTGEHVSWCYPFAESDKKIDITLKENVNELELSFSGETLKWSGINVILPEKYAVNRWYYECYYDAVQDGRTGNEIHPAELRPTSTVMICPNSIDTGRRIEILSSVEYRSEAMFQEANATVAKEWTDTIAKHVPKAQIRLESPTFSLGTSQASAEQYFEDSLGAMNAQGFGWYISDFFSSLVLQIYAKDILAGGRAVDYKNYHNFNPELLKKLQECLPE